MPAGDWTRALFIKCKEKQWIQGEKQRYGDSSHEADDVEMLGNSRYRLTVDINGPYGAPAQEYGKFNVLLLVVQPFLVKVDAQQLIYVQRLTAVCSSIVSECKPLLQHALHCSVNAALEFL